MKVAIVFHQLNILPARNIRIAIRTIVNHDVNAEVFLLSPSKNIIKKINADWLIRLNTTVIDDLSELSPKYKINAVLKVSDDADLIEDRLFDKVCTLMSWSSKWYKEITII